MNIPELERKILQLISEDNITAFAPQFKLYAKECSNFNGKVRTCLEMIEKKQLSEAGQIVESEKPLLWEAFALFTLHKNDTFKQFCAEHKYPTPPMVSEDDVLKVQAALGQFRSIAPLLEAYRAIARNGALQDRVFLLRKIVVLNSSSEWLSTLKQCETQLYKELIDQAKSAVIEKNFETLAKIQKQLLSPEWHIPGNDVVLSKINAVLAEHHRKKVLEHAEKLLQDVNNAYSEFNVPALAEALAFWDNLWETEKNVQPEKKALVQVEEAREYFEQEQKKIQDELKYNRLINSLNNGIVNERPLPELQKYFNTLKSMDRPIPQELVGRFVSYQDSVELVEKRKFLVKTGSIVIAAVLVIGGCAWLTWSLIQNHKERQWVSKLENALAKEAAPVAVALLADLNKEAPEISKRPSIMELSEKVRQKKEQYDIKVKKFNDVASEMSSKLKDFAKYKQELAALKVRLMPLISDEKTRQAYYELQRQYESLKTTFEEKENNRYISLCRQIGTQRELFYAALEKENLDVALKALEKAEAFQSELANLTNVSGRIRMEYSSRVSEVANMRSRMTTLLKARKDQQDIWAELTNTTSFEHFNANAQRYAQAISGSSFGGDIQKFVKNELKYASIFHEGKAEKKAAFPAYAQDLLRFGNLKKQRSLLVEALKQESQNNLASAAKSPMYMLILQNEDGKFCTLCFMQRPTVTMQAGQDVRCQIRCLKDLSGGFQTYEFDYSHNDNIARLISLESGDVIFRGKLTYPDSFVLAPPLITNHFWQKISDLIQETPEKVEENLCSVMNEIISDEKLPHIIRWILLSNLAKHLVKVEDSADEGKSMYKKWNEAITALKKCIPAEENFVMQNYSASTVDALKAGFNKLGANPFSDKTRAESNALQNAILREIKPAGFLFHEKGQVKFRHFASAPVKGEAWLLNDNGNFVMAGSYTDLEFKGDTANLPPLKIVFTPVNGAPTNLDASYNFRMPAMAPRKAE